jgi:TonB-linked SusC/RagA family outer membrane protein
MNIMKKSAISEILMRQLRRRVTKRVMLLPVLLFLFAAGGIAQNITVKGKVTSNTGTPVEGASVTLKGTGTGTSTDAEGNFQLSAPSNGKLIISSVNFAEREVAINGRTNINITLESADNLLTNVIVVGYGTQRKADVTGSLVRVDEKALREVPVANLTQALTGRAAGIDIARTSVRPGQAGQIRIRGNRSLTGSNDPLLVVDGIPYGGDINDLNPDDIASVDILKDASATAIYGSRGASGVIIITTKRGSRSGKALLSVNSYFGVSEITDQYNMMNSQEFAKYRTDAQYSGGNTADEQAGLANGTNTDWQGLVYQKGYISNNEISISGGNAETQYGLSGGYYRETGIFDFISFDRYTLRATIDQKIGKRIKIGLNSLNTLSYNHGGGINPMYAILRTAPMISPYLPDGSLNYKPALGSVDEPFYTNPLLLKGNKDIMKDVTRRLRTFNSLYGEIEIIKGLKYRLNVGLDFRHQYRGIYNGAGAFTNATSILDQQGTVNPLLNNASIINDEAWSYLIENIVTYERTFNAKHRLNFTGLYSTQEFQNFGSGFNATGIPANYIQEYNFLQAGTVTVAGAGNNSFSKQGLLSYMGRANYVYDNKYLLTATIRRDGSSVLSPGSQWFTYPAVAVGWNVNNEQFMSGVDFVSNLKLRLGWGKTSNQGIAPYSTLGGLSTNFYNYGSSNITGYFVSSLPNKDLKWESTTNKNIGIDFEILNRRLSGTIDYYSQETKDILVNKSLPISNGATSFVTNAAKTKGHGLEISLSSVNIKSASGFTWETDFNFTINREEIVELEDPAKKQDIGNGWFVGHPLTVIYDFKKIGIWQTSEAAEATSFGSKPGRIKIADLDKSGSITAADRMIIGDFQPDWIGGMTNRFSYKNFDLSFVAFARWGGDVVVTYFQSNAGGTGGYPFFGQGRANVFKYDYWTPTNPTNDFPQPDGNTNNADYYSTLGYRDGTFIKMRSINLGYTLPSSLCKRFGINSLRMYLQAQNPFIVYSPLVRDGYGIDPEGTGFGNALASQGGGTTAPGRAITIGIQTPPTRSWILGINLKL